MHNIQKCYRWQMFHQHYYGLIIIQRLYFTLCLFFTFCKGQAASGHFWHITDLHLDTKYNPAGDPVSVCPSSASRPVQNAGRFGDYICDSPWLLINSSIYAMRDILPDPDFIVWTGDDTPHVPNEQLGEEAVLAIVANLTNIIQQVFPGTKVFSALGNHDYHPKSQLPAGENTIYNRTAELWKAWLEQDSLPTFRKGGFYTERLLKQPGQRAMVLNTNLYYDQNKVTAELQDPAGQFQWMDKVLEAAAANNEKVYIMGHVPPGFFEKKRLKHWFRPQFNERYLQLVQKHHAVIAGQFFGHHHTDSFRMFYSQDGSPISTMFLTPGITPWKTTLPGVENGANNPGIRVFEYDPDTLLVKDIVTYYLNLTYANLARARWEKEYRLCESFRVPDASPASMHLVLRRLAEESRFLQTYYDFNSVNYDLSPCNADCRLDHVCAIRAVGFPEYELCVQSAADPRLPPLPTLLCLALTLPWAVL
ncbi:acid sphingomyelinase-like phosphodiesterase 3b isoform X2 [Amia ocellicauda]|uniref:acid sphingomyelinase-like phosphodiesterase 3b isoform X2 n=1 Tax=Amia ocellicauda TaxID=2972642 RepID=UPI003463D281